MNPLTQFTDRAIRNIETVIVGKRQQIEWLMVALLCQGHVLIRRVAPQRFNFPSKSPTLLVSLPPPGSRHYDRFFSGLLCWGCFFTWPAVTCAITRNCWKRWSS